MGRAEVVDHGPIQVMIVDDHAVVRSGLSAFLMALDDLEFVGDANGGAEAVGKCRGSEKLIDRSPAPKLRRLGTLPPRVDGRRRKIDSRNQVESL